MKVLFACIAMAAFAATLTSAAPYDEAVPENIIEEEDDEIFSGEKGEKSRWPNATLVYSIIGNFTANQTSQIAVAMAQITRLTASSNGLLPLPCITFRQATALDTHIVQIDNTKDECNSPVGRQKANQTLMLGDSCFKKGKTWGTLAHEMIHALGFHHEQCRMDRDTYIKVLTENIKEKGLDNYAIKNNTDTFGVPYDYASIMHYSSTEYSKDTKTLKSMKSIPEGKESLMGQRGTLTNCDIAKLRLMYNCTGGTVIPTECKV